jgi:hypothetical protein
MSGLANLFKIESSRISLLLLIFLKIFFFLFIVSCETDNCDLSEYPSSPLSEPYAVQYGDDWVEYTYVCVDGYNEIWTYRIEQGCWEAYRDTQWNSICD